MRSDHSHRQIGGLVLAVCGLVMPPASGDQSPRDQVRSEAEERTGVRAGARPPDQGAPPELHDLLAEGVTRDEAVQIALMGNARLQATFAELGIAEADLVQAGLYTNPGLDVLLRSPTGASGTEWEVELGFSLADLWRVPRRRQVAAAELARATMAATNEVLNTVADARRAHDSALVCAARAELADQVLGSAQAWRDHIYQREGFGYTSELDKSMADAAVAERAVEAQTARAEQAIAVARVARVLGLGPDTDLVLTGALPDPPGAAPDAALLVEQALAQRPDVLAARWGVTAAEGALGLARRSVWNHVALGPAYAHEPDGADLWGAMLTAELPLFDSNRAGRQRAAAQLNQRRWDRDALEALAREQVTVAAERLALALQRERLLREEVLPAHQRALDYATRYAAEMQLNLLYQLKAQEELYAARRGHLDALGQTLAAQVELEFAVGGRITEG